MPQNEKGMSKKNPDAVKMGTGSATLSKIV